MQKLLLLTATFGLGLIISGCASQDGTITTSTPTGPGITESGTSGTTVETVPSGLGAHGTGPGSAGTGGNGASAGAGNGGGAGGGHR